MKKYVAVFILISVIVGVSLSSVYLNTHTSDLRIQIEKELRKKGIPIFDLSVDKDNIVWLFLDDGYYDCSDFIGTWTGMEVFCGACYYFDIKDIEMCKKIQRIDVYPGLIINIDCIGELPCLQTLSGCLLAPPKNPHIQNKLNHMAGVLELLVTANNIDLICSFYDKHRYSLRITERLFMGMSDDEKAKLRKAGYRTINSCRADVFWEKPRFDKELLWELIGQPQMVDGADTIQHGPISIHSWESRSNIAE